MVTIINQSSPEGREIESKEDVMAAVDEIKKVRLDEFCRVACLMVGDGIDDLKLTLEKCKTALAFLEDEFFSLPEDAKDTMDLLAAGYHRAQIMTGIVEDYLFEADKKVSALEGVLDGLCEEEGEVNAENQG